MFHGVSALHLDAKGRMAVPSRYREKLLADGGNQVIVTLDPNGRCLLLYAMREWEQLEQTLVRLPNLDEGAYLLKHALLGHATDCELDAQGRILLPAIPRSMVSVERQVALVGMGNKFEIWDEAAWQARSAACIRAVNAPGYTPPEALRNLVF